MNLIDSGHSQLLAKALDNYTLRQKVTASNIANIDTPGYKKHEVQFEDALQKARKSGGNTNDIPTEITETDEDVILENELMKTADNQMRVQLVTRSLRHHFDMLKTGITSTTR